jgi:predicted transcriptional regulator
MHAMKAFDFLEKMSVFNRLVEQECTGKPEEFAARLGISRSTLYDIIDELRSRDVEVGYSRTGSTFYYKNSVSLEVRLTVKRLEEISVGEAKKITGGCKIFASVLFFGRKDFTFVPE